MSATTLTFQAKQFIQRRWRWPWLHMHWEVQTLSEDYRFVCNGAFLWGMESFEAMRLGR